MKTTIQETQMASRSPAEQAVRFSFAKKITDITMAARFIDSLADANLMFHLEDAPAEIINFTTEEYLFSAHEAVLLRKRVRELYSFDWSRYDTECPIGYFLTYCLPNRSL
jgi:hypothetical protein